MTPDHPGRHEEGGAVQVQGSVIKEQGKTFAVVAVKRDVLQNLSEADRIIEAMSPIFPGLPIALMAKDLQGAPIYYGRLDFSKFLASVDMGRIPWKKYTVNI